MVFIERLVLLDGLAVFMLIVASPHTAMDGCHSDNTGPSSVSETNQSLTKTKLSNSSFSSVIHHFKIPVLIIHLYTT